MLQNPVIKGLGVGVSASADKRPYIILYVESALDASSPSLPHEFKYHANDGSEVTLAAVVKEQGQIVPQ